MRLIILMAIVFIATAASASPFLVCDPQAGVTHYEITGPTWVPTEHPAQADGSIRMDVSGANVGINSLTVRACNFDSVWGEQCSEAVPFDFTRPGRANTPSGVRLTP